MGLLTVLGLLELVNLLPVLKIHASMYNYIHTVNQVATVYLTMHCNILLNSGSEMKKIYIFTPSKHKPLFELTVMYYKKTGSCKMQPKLCYIELL